MSKNLAELDMHFEGRGFVGLCAGGEIGAEKFFCAFRGRVCFAEDAGGVDQRRSFAVVGIDGRLKSVDHPSRLMVALVEVAPEGQTDDEQQEQPGGDTQGFGAWE